MSNAPAAEHLKHQQNPAELRPSRTAEGGCPHIICPTWQTPSASKLPPPASPPRMPWPENPPRDKPVLRVQRPGLSRRLKTAADRTQLRRQFATARSAAKIS